MIGKNKGAVIHQQLPVHVMMACSYILWHENSYLRKRCVTECMSGLLFSFLFQQSSMTFHAADERPNLEASFGLLGRLPLGTISITLRSGRSGKGKFPVKI
jgi:hypothetical protein